MLITVCKMSFYKKTIKEHFVVRTHNNPTLDINLMSVGFGRFSCQPVVACVEISTFIEFVCVHKGKG